MDDEAAVAWLRKQIEGELDFGRAHLEDMEQRPCKESDLEEMRGFVADGEAKLAILGVHQRYDCCFGCEHCDDDWPCQTVHLLACAYRHRDGYQEHWGDRNG